MAYKDLVKWEIIFILWKDSCIEKLYSQKKIVVRIQDDILNLMTTTIENAKLDYSWQG